MEAQPQRDVEPGRQSDHGKTRIDGQGEVESVVNHEHRRRLTDDREPAQQDERIETHVTVWVSGGRSWFSHAASVRSRPVLLKCTCGTRNRPLRFLRRGVTSASLWTCSKRPRLPL